MPVRYDPEDAAVGGALPEGNYRFTNTAFEQGKTRGGVPSITLVVDLVNEENGQKQDWHWSCGDYNSFAPSLDPDGAQPAARGPYLQAIGQREQLSSSCQFMELLFSLRDAGYPSGRRTMHVGTDFDGMLVHLIPQQAEDRVGLGKRDRPEIIYVAADILELPWEAKTKAAVPGTTRPGMTRILVRPPSRPAGGPGAPSGSGPAISPRAPARPATGQQDGQVSPEAAEKLTTVILAALEDSGGAVPVTVIRTRVFQQHREDPDRPAMASLLSNPEYLAGLGEEQGIVYDGKSLVRA